MVEEEKTLEKMIGKVPEIFKELKETDPDLYGKVMGLDQMIWADGALSKQTKKIIAIAIAAALRDGHAVRAQMAGAGELGVKKEEIEEGLRVAFLLAGMPAYVCGKAALEEILGDRPRR
ncbi:MAG TPA: carboxymuconolactone decarboxylase family protein [Candidatus Methanoculleus thermohydrogenotrophicum]|jgi:4-carboxymuconolactone decarboxylase|nr:carboxymuconolactone decarboxylase family protein [Candidatus Methanoculleus thermohydrogenotrophicum]NLM82365.1 carboxymuconolactone decarboxylase family protein [Candidatus Methanoculleus thermohydrogenotrophicum]HOB17205.1 carboxymuconolactone decarboxylase family protein [Candidatus Methanoculleus thermohydrogenotrophicum]HPZ37285.1 carboxymuconolactone decarboxylase family protein [Candidatus Methanoculleus thermohydrogenotrophicum]HQC90502.1 carboxymuconolactone decarboxylase family pr